MKKVCFPASRSLSGGSNNSALLLAKFYNKQKYNPIFVLPDKGPAYKKIKEAGLTAKVLPFNFGQERLHITNYSIFGKIITGFKILPYILEAKEFLKDNDIDIVHTNDLLSTLIWGGAGKLTRIKVIWHIRQLKSSKYLDLLRLLFSDHLIFVAHQNKNKFPPFVTSLKSHDVIYNGIEFCNDKLGSLRKELNLNVNTKIVGYVGYLEERKRPDKFIEIAKKVLEDGRQDVHFIIVGANSGNFDYELHLKKLVKDYNIEASFNFLGYRKDICNIMNSLDILILTSTKDGEAFPRVVIEAMGAGVPVVCSNSAGVIESVEENVTGFIIDSDLNTEFAEKVQLLLNNKEKALSMGIKGKQKAHDKFDAQNISEKVQEIYSEI